MFVDNLKIGTRSKGIFKSVHRSGEIQIRAGVTAFFNKALLTGVNRFLGGKIVYFFSTRYF